MCSHITLKNECIMNVCHKCIVGPSTGQIFPNSRSPSFCIYNLEDIAKSAKEHRFIFEFLSHSVLNSSVNNDMPPKDNEV